jgi:hypothetical protein
MVFSTVQISMPGTSCAGALLDISAQVIGNKHVIKIIRPIIGPSSVAPKCLKQPSGSCQTVSTGGTEPNILQPHSGAEI